MSLEELKANWDGFGRTDPLWSILTDPDKRGNKWSAQEFFDTGSKDIDDLMNRASRFDACFLRGKALDFGCGVGRLTQPLCAYFGEVHGVDIAPSMIELANTYNRHPDSCTYHLNESGGLSMFPDGEFDLVYTSRTLQHMEPQYARVYLREFVRILRPGGLLAFQVPDSPDYRHIGNKLRKAAPAFVIRAFRKLAYGRGPRMEMHTIPREEVIDMLEGEGAKLLAVENDESARQFISYVFYASK